MICYPKNTYTEPKPVQHIIIHCVDAEMKIFNTIKYLNYLVVTMN